MNYVSRCDGIKDSWQTECPCANRTSNPANMPLFLDRCPQILVFNAQRQYPDNILLFRDDLSHLDSAVHLKKRPVPTSQKPHRFSITKINCRLVSESYENPEQNVQIMWYIHLPLDMKGTTVSTVLHTGAGIHSNDKKSENLGQ